MKYLILKTVNADGKAYGGFIWPTEGPVEADVWVPTSECSGGLHGLLNGRGKLSLLNWDPEARWILFEAEALVGWEGHVKAPKGTVVYYGNRDGALQILADRADLSLRGWVCQDPDWAYRYAIHVDKGPRDDTRAAACRDPKMAYWYAVRVDKCARDDTREVACEKSKWAYMYAHYVDGHPRDDTREAACQGSCWAYIYALFVDQRPRDDTRTAACGHPEWAYHYAFKVDKCARDDTRVAACQEPEWVAKYSVWEKNLGFLA